MHVLLFIGDVCHFWACSKHSFGSSLIQKTDNPTPNSLYWLSQCCYARLIKCSYKQINVLKMHHSVYAF